MHDFRLDKDKCISCGLCVRDCHFGVLRMEDGNPDFANPDRCIGCLHCFAICPEGAITMDGNDPASAPAIGKLPSPESVADFIRQRRSIRNFRHEDIDPATMRQMLELAWSAPSGINQHRLLISVIDDSSVMAAFREALYGTLAQLYKAGKLDQDYLLNLLGPDSSQWPKDDAILRGAPHLVVASAAPDAATGVADCLIYLSCLELVACSRGFGTLWCGILNAILEQMPEVAGRLGIPAENRIGYTMLLGKPALHYARGVERSGARIQIVDGRNAAAR